MRIYDIIEKKKHGKVLSKEEIEFTIRAYLQGEIPDYQVSALLMAIWFNGMQPQETTDLTLSMAHSGDMVDLSAIEGMVVDKHSTGGVGDKTTFIVTPIAACLGVKIAKMSGRGLGHTGGTVDKMEAIPGLRTQLEPAEFFEIVNRVGACVIGQTGNLAPADKKIYALRDVTATVDSIPLIASSIMSKKLASGAGAIVLDVKVGSGAFMKDIERAEELARTMVEIGKLAGRKVVALITDMDQPLGQSVGNRNEMAEVIQTLRGQGPKDLTDLSIELASQMIVLGREMDLKQARKEALATIESGEAYAKFIEMIQAQGADISYLEDLDAFASADHQSELLAGEKGIITQIDAQEVGLSAAMLGAGRKEVTDTIDYTAGIKLHKKVGDQVLEGEVLAVLQSADADTLQAAKERLRAAYQFGDGAQPRPLIFKTIN
ncbi:MAG: thymidine phosphorylase [Tissierellia bacterium]|nr:thymidine phosphorylase [Tissierellia bacterium]